MVPIAIFAWFTGALMGVLLSIVYGGGRRPEDVEVGIFLPTKAQPALATPPAPSRSSTPDCPARRYWTSCDPIPRTASDVEKALMSPRERLGWIRIMAIGWGNVRVDDVSYGRELSAWTHQPIVPGEHVIDVFDYLGMRRARCDIDIMPGRRALAVVSMSGNCVVSDVTDQIKSQ